MFLEKNADVLVVFADHPKVDKIFPLAAQFGRTIIVLNSGAKYPVDWQAPDFVLFLTLGEMLSAKLAAKKSINLTGIIEGINTTNFYDGGYGIGDGFYLGQESAGGKVVFNFIGKHLEADFDPQPLVDYLSENQGKFLIFSIYTGKILPLFLKAIKGFGSKVTLVCSQAMIQEIVAKEHLQGMSLPEIFAFSSLNPEWKNQGFQPINEYIKNEVKRDVSPFSYLGWDAGEVIMRLSSKINYTWPEKVKQLEDKTIKGSRGNLKFHSKTGHFIGDQYQVRLRDRKLEVSKIELNEVFEEWEKFIETRSQPPQVGWFNTYLCS
ncbi:type 1 periplasmic-binding domain-containing protein [Algoriphagus hitonicola]|nr:ABC transporter substrate-binding protein [Algoriphagus hitonicola]